MKTSRRLPIPTAIVTLFIAIFLADYLSAKTTLKVSTALLTPESTIEIIFDRAIIAENEVHQTSDNRILVIKPKLPGKILWKSSNVAEFIPTQAPQMGTAYSFSIAKSLRFADHQKLAASDLGIVRSEPFRIHGSSRTTKSLSSTRQPSHYVYFNDAVNPEKIEKSAYYSNKSGQKINAQIRRATWGDIQSRYRRGQTWQDRFADAHSKYPTRYIEDDAEPIPNAIMATPVTPLPIGDEWSLTFKQKTSNEKKSASLVADRDIWIGNVEPFELEEIDAYVAANKPRQIQITFNLPLNRNLSQEQLKKSIQISPAVDAIKFTIDGRRVLINGDLRKQDNWNIKIDSSLTSLNALALENTKGQKIKFLPVPSGLALPTFDSAQYAYGNRQYGIETVNLESLRVQVKQLTSDKAVRTMQGYNHYKGSGHNNKNIKPTHPMPYALIDGATIYDRQIVLDNPIDTSRDINLDWNTAIPNNNRTGFYFISVEGTAKKGSRGGSRIAQAFVQLTDIGLCWKLNDQEAFIYAFSCKTGQPLSNVSLQVYNNDAQKAGVTTTNNKGIARLPRHQNDRHLLAHHGDDSYIIPFDRTLNTVSLWRFPVDIEWNHLAGWKRTVLLFTDRSLYRPGETLHLKGIVRQYFDNQVTFSKDKIARLKIKDSASRLIYDQDVTLSNNGTFDQSITLPSETTGRFLAQLIFKKSSAQDHLDSWLVDRYRIFHHEFNVQEFRRNAFEITSEVPTPAPGAKQIQLNIGAQYYQGQAVKEGQLAWNLNAKETGFYPNKFRDFMFANHRSYDPYYWSHYFGYGSGSHRKNHDQHGQGTLNLKGQSSLEFNLPERSFPAPLAVSIHSEITDTRDQTLSQTSATLVHPADTYIGIERVDSLFRVGEKSKFKLIAVDHHGEARTHPVTINAMVEREYHEAVKIKSEDGKTRVENTKRTNTVLEQRLTLTAEQLSTFSFTPEKPGRHIITLTGEDQNGHAFATARGIHVYGTKEYPWAVEDGMKIKLVPEKKQYHSGETARILVMTPIEGSALITVERAGVHREFRQELKASSPVIEVPLTDLDAPNVYISVIIMRGADASPLKHKEPALKLGYCSLNVADKKNHLTVELEMEGSKHRPDEPTTISGTVTYADGSPAPHAELTVYAEDEGTLAVTGYTTPAPFDHFYAKRALLVKCGTSFSTFVPENSKKRYYSNKGFTIGGGGNDAFGAQAPDIKTRSNFNPCAIWKPKVQTDNNGRFSITYKNPDTLTRYRVIAIAVEGEHHFGGAQTSYTVDQPIMLEATPPRYASEGDHLRPKALIQNNSPHTGTWEISLTTSNVSELSSASPTTQQVTLNPGESQTVFFDVHFINTGTAHWQWTARPLNIEGQTSIQPALSRELSDQCTNEFEVTYPVPLMRAVQWHTLDQNKQHNLINGIQPELLNGRGHIDIHLSNSLLMEAGEAVDFLLNYPYGCLEQTSSAMMPWLAVDDLKTYIPSLQDTSREKINQTLQDGVNRILSTQTRDGGLAYWPGGDRANDWASAYGGMALVMAQKQGTQVPASVINNLTQWIEDSLKEKPAETKNRVPHSWDQETRARALYVLALAGSPQVAMQHQMLEDEDSLSDGARAFLALAMHHSGGDKNQALRLIEKAPCNQQRGSHWMRHQADKAILVFALCEIAPDSPKVHQAMHDLLQHRNPYGHWRTTWCNAWAIQAMASYARSIKSKTARATESTSTVELTINGEKQIIRLSSGQHTHSLRVPLQAGLQLSVKSDNTCHINQTVSAKPQIAPKGPWGHNGLSIIRRYERVMADGTTTPLGQAKVGDLVLVSLDVTFAQAMDYVVIEDRLPAMFECVNNNFSSQRSRIKTNSENTWEISHKELRSDRSVFFLDRTWRNGSETISYLARVTFAGQASAPAAKIEAMYEPEQIALSASQTITTQNK